MNTCEHDICWNISDENVHNCLICLLSFLENDDEPLIYRENVFHRFLSGITCTPKNYFSVFGQCADVVKRVLAVLFKIYLKISDHACQKDLSHAIVLFETEFGEPIFHVLMEFVEHMCTILTSCKDRIALYGFLLELSYHLSPLLDKVLSKGRFIESIVSALSFPDGQLRMLLLQLTAKLASRQVEKNGSLHLFKDLPGSLFTLLLTCDDAEVPVITGSLYVLQECAKSNQFPEWVVGTYSERNELQGPSKVFSAIKRIFLLRQDTFNLVAVQTLQSLLQHDELVRPMLDADLVELMYDALCASVNETLILSVYECILVLTNHLEFFVSCHAMYGLKPVCMSLAHLLHSRVNSVVCLGYEVLEDLFDRHPSDVPLLQTLSLCDQVLEVVVDGIKSETAVVVTHAVSTSCNLLRHLPQPLLNKDILSLWSCIVSSVPSFIIEVRESSSQCPEEEMLQGSKKLLTDVFRFCNEIIRIAAFECHTDDFRESPEQSLIEIITNSLQCLWIPLLESNIYMLQSPDVMKSFFVCMAAATGSSVPANRNLIEIICAEAIIEAGFKVKASSPSLNDAFSEFLFAISAPFLLSLECTFDSERLCRGYKTVRGMPRELLHYLTESCFVSCGRFDVPMVDVHCAVMTVFALSASQGIRFCSNVDLIQALFSHDSLHEDMKDQPFIMMKLKLFLYSICQEDSCAPELPRSLVERLLLEDSLYIHHPAVLSVLLQCPNKVISEDIKIDTIRSWISRIDIVGFDVDSYVKHLVGLTLLSRDVASLVVNALSSCTDESEMNKLILIITDAINESSDDTDFSNDFLDLLGPRLPEVLKLDWDTIRNAPPSVTASTLGLLHTLIEKNSSTTDASFYQHVILRKMILLVNSGLSASEADIINDEVLSLLLDNISRTLELAVKPEIQVAALAMIVSNREFILSLEKLLLRPVMNYHLCNVHYDVFKLLSILLSLENNCTTKVQHCINYKAETLLKFVEGNFDPRFQCAILFLWRVLFETKFQGNLFKLKPTVQRGNKLYSRDEVVLAPLNRPFLLRLFTFVLNCSTQSFPEIRANALRCVYCMLNFAMATKSGVYSDMTLSGWLPFCLGSDQCESSEEENMCQLIKSLLPSPADKVELDVDLFLTTCC